MDVSLRPKKIENRTGGAGAAKSGRRPVPSGSEVKRTREKSATRVGLRAGNLGESDSKNRSSIGGLSKEPWEDFCAGDLSGEPRKSADPVGECDAASLLKRLKSKSSLDMCLG